MENICRNMLGLMFGPKAFEVLDIMKEVITQEEFKHPDNISRERKEEILAKIQERLNNKKIKR